MMTHPTSGDPEGRKRPRRRRPAARSNESLEELVKAVKFLGAMPTPETRQEIKSRLQIAEAAAAHLREMETRKAKYDEWRDRIVLKWALAAIAVVGVSCLAIIALLGVSQESRSWSSSTLTGMVGGLVGFLIGKVGKLGLSP